MVDSHFAERRLPGWGKGSFVHWAKKPAGKAVIFIHGFNGSPEDTFSDFEILFRTIDSPAGWDVFFYGYDSLFQSAESSAVEFQEFLRFINENSISLFNDSMKRYDKERAAYEKNLIVAHSLGAVVSRLALLNSYKANRTWVNNCKLLLFAPAHKGTSPTLTALITGEALPGLFKLMSVTAGFFVPTIKELQGNSVVLDDLERETLSLIEKKITTFTVAKAVIWAAKERVVRNKSFGKDPESMLIPRTTHSSVCKPNNKFLLPLEIFDAHLQ